MRPDLLAEWRNVPGWSDDDESIWLHDRASRMRSIVEVRSWKGRSSYALVSARTSFFLLVGEERCDAPVPIPRRTLGEDLASRGSASRQRPGTDSPHRPGSAGPAMSHSVQRQASTATCLTRMNALQKRLFSLLGLQQFVPVTR